MACTAFWPFIPTYELPDPERGSTRAVLYWEGTPLYIFISGPFFEIYI